MFPNVQIIPCKIRPAQSSHLFQDLRHHFYVALAFPPTKNYKLREQHVVESYAWRCNTMARPGHKRMTWGLT